jgi:hypothetical protein
MWKEDKAVAMPITELQLAINLAKLTLTIKVKEQGLKTIKR